MFCLKVAKPAVAGELPVAVVLLLVLALEVEVDFASSCSADGFGSSDEAAVREFRRLSSRSLASNSACNPPGCKLLRLLPPADADSPAGTTCAFAFAFASNGLDRVSIAFMSEGHDALNCRTCFRSAARRFSSCAARSASSAASKSSVWASASEECASSTVERFRKSEGGSRVSVIVVADVLLRPGSHSDVVRSDSVRRSVAHQLLGSTDARLLDAKRRPLTVSATRECCDRVSVRGVGTRCERARRSRRRSQARLQFEIR